MSDKGLSDEAAVAACKDGDPVTKVRWFIVPYGSSNLLVPDTVKTSNPEILPNQQQANSGCQIGWPAIRIAPFIGQGHVSPQTVNRSPADKWLGYVKQND